MSTVLYPTITGAAGRQFFDACDVHALSQRSPQIADLPVEWIEVGPPGSPGAIDTYDTKELYDFARRATDQIGRRVFDVGLATQAGERFEAAHAIEFHALLHDIPGGVLNDRGLWRFLALGPLFSCVVWRQSGKNLPTAFGLPPATGRRRRERAFSLTRNLPWRLFMRAEIGGPEYVDVIGADLWWSHLFQVALGRSLATAHAFLEEAKAEPIAIQRLIAPRVTADRGRFVFDALDDEEITARVRGIAERVVSGASRAEEAEADPALLDDSSVAEDV